MKNLILVLIIKIFVLRSVFADEIKIETQVGDLRTDFSFDLQKQHSKLTIVSSEKGQKVVLLGEKNTEWVKDRIQEIYSITDGNEVCSRDQVRVFYFIKMQKKLQFETCLLSKTKRAESMRSFLNTLSVLF